LNRSRSSDPSSRVAVDWRRGRDAPDALRNTGGGRATLTKTGSIWTASTGT
jgi:hypothetical protein